MRVIHRCGLYTEFKNNFLHFQEVRVIHRCGLYTGNYGYIRKNSSFALNLTFSNSFKYKFKLDSPNFYVDDYTRKVVDSLKKNITLLFFIIVTSRSDGCWLTGHTCSDGHISSLLYIHIMYYWKTLFQH